MTQALAATLDQAAPSGVRRPAAAEPFRFIAPTLPPGGGLALYAPAYATE